MMLGQSWSLIKFNLASDSRGDLLAIEFHEDIPFVPKRFFATFNVPSLTTRGEHAHRECDQIFFPLAGEIRVSLSDGIVTEEFLLSDPSLGLYVPKLTWGKQESLKPDSILGVLASDTYDTSDYIRDYNQFLEFKEKFSKLERLKSADK